ncbi:UNVERIFIED_CONTAM: hypothetical protein PYX00_008794 [Menopon gallinae]|uniref:FYVE-type domain-containing protein n=1 Tax=Menopon gallinae TaxID=328185 RepID=A0AAW2HQT2_9NEOP
MSCHGCATKFTVFKSELSCPYCSFSFCSKCLKQEANIEGKSQKVCRNCFKILVNQENISSSFDPPALLVKRLEIVENPAKPPITIFRQKDKLCHLKDGLDEEDKLIVERLERLRGGRRENPPSEVEIHRRLLALKGVEEKYGERPNILQSSSKSVQEEVDDLLKEYIDENELELRMNEDVKSGIENIEKRLQKLNTQNSKPSNFPEKDDDDDGIVTKRVVEKLIVEAELEKKWNSKVAQTNSDDSENMDLEQEHELPWCIICNEDAVVRCLGCENCLYCMTCFKEGHDVFEMKHHKAVNATKKES